MNLDDLLPSHVAKPETNKVWSPQQDAIYAHTEHTDSNILVEAVAGSGKTTSIIEAMRRAGGRTCFLAFNRAIADELKSRVSGGDVKTLNGLGHGLMLRHRPGAKLVQWKTSNYLRSKTSRDVYELFGKELVRAIGIAKGLGVGIIREASSGLFTEIIDSYGLAIPPEHIPTGANLSHRAFLDVTSPDLAGEFDFDDQLYVPVREGWTFPRYDTVFVDEAQDLNTIQHLILDKLRDRGARIIAVGDRRQAIYGFRGALSNSMDKLSGTFSMVEFPLSTTYRCATSIVALAQTIVPQITARDNAPDGEVKSVDEYPGVESYSDTGLVICRNNAPIFELALQFLKAQRACRVMSNFLEEMDKFIESFKATDTKILLERLDAWYEKQKLDCETRGLWGKLEGLQDRYAVVSRFAREFSKTSDLLRAVAKLSNSTTGPRIATIHKAKGLEADTVYLLRYDLLPSARAVTAEARIQEENLKYVAITRAKNSLIILPKEI